MSSLVLNKLLGSLAFIVLLATPGLAQNEKPATNQSSEGSFFAYWGWNRSTYSRSTLHLDGENFDFSLKDLSASDRPTAFSAKQYFNPAFATIPQFNFRLGYFFHSNYNISIGTDHMKYVLDQQQHTSLSGSFYGDDFYDEPIEIQSKFLQFEHTDGLNYINVALNRWDQIFHSRHVTLSVTEGVGFGGLLPKTRVILLGRESYDDFHLSGYGTDVHAGLNVELFRYFFIQAESKVGFINMPDIRISTDEAESARQHFFFSEHLVVFGARFRLWRSPTALTPNE